MGRWVVTMQCEGKAYISGGDSKQRYNYRYMLYSKRAGSVVFMANVLFLLCVAGTVAERSNITVGSRCMERPIYYLQECLKMEECAWCCERPVGLQCVDRPNPHTASSVCNEYALISDIDNTCGQLCYAAQNNCKLCEARNWCYFCISWEICQPPYAECEKGEVIQSCSMMEKGNVSIFWFTVLIVVGGVCCCCALIAGVVLVMWRRYQQVREEEETFVEETRPFLTSAARTEEVARCCGEAGDLAAVVPEERQALRSQVERQEGAKMDAADDESLCFLCLDASPAVTFLPCYHTCCCEACSNRLRPTGDDELTCPFCRAKIVSMVCLRNLLQQISTQS